MEGRECSASGIRLIVKGIFGGPDRDRTDDLFHAMEARSQLRHRPTCCFKCNSPILSAAAGFVKPRLGMEMELSGYEEGWPNRNLCEEKAPAVCSAPGAGG